MIAEWYWIYNLRENHREQDCMHRELSFVFSHISSNWLQASLQSISKAQTPLGNSLASTATAVLKIVSFHSVQWDMPHYIISSKREGQYSSKPSFSWTWIQSHIPFMTAISLGAALQNLHCISTISKVDCAISINRETMVSLNHLHSSSCSHFASLLWSCLAHFHMNVRFCICCVLSSRLPL